ncbi:hypothetical protein [Falsigemmobacter faecalis]|uniref:Uncharacterized protein n=1 Tax=Falsigemmobacter faecalis TaxID=2488730 RepID=A0A3P3D9N7_9RHOB|nr:hypothetical protein [Falsigemmobacter faecalis]RRH71069.1 hypothetical protein EG244_16865 [Falsigemmobacter faecalis]
MKFSTAVFEQGRDHDSDLNAVWTHARIVLESDAPGDTCPSVRADIPREFPPTVTFGEWLEQFRGLAVAALRAVADGLEAGQRLDLHKSSVQNEPAYREQSALADPTD